MLTFFTNSYATIYWPYAPCNWTVFIICCWPLLILYMPNMANAMRM